MIRRARPALPLILAVLGVAWWTACGAKEGEDAVPTQPVPAERVPTILVTGFGPFGPHAVNPSWAVLEGLDGQHVGRYDVRTARLDVAYAKAGDQLAAALAEARPDAVLCLGVAPGEHLRIEVVARNRDACPQPDVEGELRSNAPIVEGGADLLRSRLPVKALLEALRGDGYEVVTSEDAGGYLCNHVFYRLLNGWEGPGPAGFVHVPEMQGPWTLPRLRKAIRRLVETL